ncbi:MAG TPA: hypothetical protein PLZ62_01215 [bacterium]|nr:hypothetical protein [bacterium]
MPANRELVVNPLEMLDLTPDEQNIFREKARQIFGPKLSFMPLEYIIATVIKAKHQN